MKEITPFWFTPDHQPTPDQPVAFLLRPLDMPTFWTLQRSFQDSNVPTWEGTSAVYEYAVQDWRGLPEQFSRAAKRSKLQAVDTNFFVWLGQITARLYTDSLLGEDERKNS